MKKQLFILLSIIYSSIYSQINRPIGVNLTGVTDYSTEFVFTDAFKQSRFWISHEDDFNADWDSGVSIPLNANGYPLEIPYNNGTDPEQIVRSVLFSGQNGQYPSGQYRLIVEGTGEVTLWGAANGTFTTPINTLVDVDPSAGAIFIEMEESLLTNPITNIKFIFPENIDNYQSQIFTTELLDFVSDFQNIRFMDWLATNFSPNTNWSERTTATYFTQTTDKGVAWEYIINLSNISQKNAWINIPHKATDNYINQVAQLLFNNLDSNLIIYLEYSNELWNGGFDQHHAIAEIAQGMGYTGESWERAWKYTAKRSADVFRIFETIFGENSPRLVKVLPSMVDDYVSSKILEHFNDTTYNPNNVTADAFAIAPYFGGSIGGDLVENNTYTSITVSEILDLAEADITNTFNVVSSIKIRTDTNNLKLITYEGGQHLVVRIQDHDKQVLIDKLIAANRDSRMGTLYCQYLNFWYQNLGGELFSVFNSHEKPTIDGSWGIKEYFSQTTAPKYTALQNCVFSYNTLSIDNLSLSPQIQVYPNPSNTNVFTIKHQLKNPFFKVYDLLGRETHIDIKIIDNTTVQIKIPLTKASILKIKSNNKEYIIKLLNYEN